jgi:CelD/BcsL family acetyltransferase involved in cellulose biosynthesis
MRNANLRVEVIRDTEQFRALRIDWEDLWTRSNGQYHESYMVCWQSWLNIAKPRGSQLRCIVAYVDFRLVMIWPLVVSTHGLWRVLRPLGPEAAEYTTILIEPEADAQALTRQAWSTAMKHCGADLVRLPYFSSQTEMYDLVRREPYRIFGDAPPASIARLTNEADWPSFAGSLGTLSGKKPGALERRLAKQGTVNVRVLTPRDAEENTRLVEWTLSRKREWAARVDKKGAWLYSSSYCDFLVALLNTHESRPIARLCLITLNGGPLVTTIIGIGQSSIKGIITGFDERFAKFSPGQLVVEYMVKWAYDNHFDFDFGVGTESFKAYWSRDNTVAVASARIASTTWGRVALSAKELVEKDFKRPIRLRRTTLEKRIGALQTAVRDKLNPHSVSATDDASSGRTRDRERTS